MSRRSFCLVIAYAVMLPLILVPRAPAADVPPAVRAAATAGRSVWVFLHDKGPVGAGKRTGDEGWISARATRRIALRGGGYDSEMDRPIYAPYRAALAAAGLQIEAESRWFNAVAGTLPPAALDNIAALECVDSLLPVAVFVQLPLDAGVDMGAPPGIVPQGTGDYDYGNSRNQIVAIQVDSLHRLGLTGHGVRVGFLDTGFSLDIDALAQLDVQATHDFLNGDSDVGDNDLSQMYHGTAVLSVCGGWAPGELIGVAPHAQYALAKTEYRNQEIQIEESYWVAGLEWLDSLGCDIVSSSLGYTDWYTSPQFDGKTAISTMAADRAAARGLLVVNAVGNNGCLGDSNHIIVPADGDSVLAVGASDFTGEKVSFSSCGPTADGRIKPDVIAPGQNVWAARPQSGRYDGESGTSLATPLVAGTCALLLEKDSTLTPYDLIQLLRGTASHARKPLNTYGWGMVQAAAAVERLATPDTTKYSLTMEAFPSDEGSVAPVSDRYLVGQQVTISATPVAGCVFVGWTGSGEGSYSGTDNPAVVVMNGPITERASFRQAFASVEVYPNPADSAVKITLPDADSVGNWTLRIYTVTGELVHEEKIIASREATWAGKNTDGRPVAAGVYLALVRTPSREEMVKIAWKPRG